jgi:outer membrane receptor protein involved in Fe transport
VPTRSNDLRIQAQNEGADMIMSRGAWVALFLTAGATASNLAVGAETAAGVNSSEGAGLEVQEVIVTARKREERLQDVPISIAAISVKSSTSGDFRTSPP